MFAVAVIISEHERESSVDAMIRKIASQRRDLGLQHYLWVEFVGSVLCYEMFFPHFALKRKATFDLLWFHLKYSPPEQICTWKIQWELIKEIIIIY